MKSRRRLLGSDETTENFWPSFTDLTSTIALILFVLVLLAYIQNLIGNKNLEYARAQLKDTIQRLSASQKEIRARSRSCGRLLPRSRPVRIGFASRRSRLPFNRTSLLRATAS